MIKIFAIGNSLTSDTTRFFTELAEHSQGYSKSVAMLIGGMTLDGHASRCLTAAREHEVYTNGINTRFKSSIPEAIASDQWDYILLQQAYGSFSDPEENSKYYTYFAHYFKMVAPKAKVIVLNTWAPYNTNEELAEENRIQKSKQYEDMAIFAAEHLGVTKESIVPAGKVVELLMQKGIPNIYRDSVHLSLSVGRYIAAQTLYFYLTKEKASGNSFRAFLKPRTEEDLLFYELFGSDFPQISENEIEVIQKTIDEVLGF